MQIRLHKGVYWETDSFILKDHSLVEKRDKTHIIRIKDVALEEDKEHEINFHLAWRIMEIMQGIMCLHSHSFKTTFILTSQILKELVKIGLLLMCFHLPSRRTSFYQIESLEMSLDMHLIESSWRNLWEIHLTLFNSFLNRHIVKYFIMIKK